MENIEKNVKAIKEAVGKMKKRPGYVLQWLVLEHAIRCPGDKIYKFERELNISYNFIQPIIIKMVEQGLLTIDDGAVNITNEGKNLFKHLTVVVEKLGGVEQ